MKKFILINFFFAVATSLFAYTVIVDNNGVLKAPKASDFKKANDILSIGGYQINIDTTPSVNSIDATETKKSVRLSPAMLT